MAEQTIAAQKGTLSDKEVKVYVAPQWKLVWWKFRKHKLALVSGIIVILIYLVAAFVEFLAPFPADKTNSKYLYAPPQPLHFFDEQGKLSFYVNGYTSKVDPVALRRTFVVDTTKKVPVRFFVEGFHTNCLGSFPATGI